MHPTIHIYVEYTTTNKVVISIFPLQPDLENNDLKKTMHNNVVWRAIANSASNVPYVIYVIANTRAMIDHEEWANPKLRGPILHPIIKFKFWSKEEESQMTFFIVQPIQKE